MNFLSLQHGTLRRRSYSLRRWLHQVKRLLVVGDGDLSYAASIAPKLRAEQVHLTATVLESSSDHANVYPDSKSNETVIRESGHDVQFAVDATQLAQHFSSEFDRIRFNFPHWRGKTNTRYNRLLLRDFFKSSADLLKPDQGRVDVALMSAQGGMHATTPTDWKLSWLPAVHAASEGLLLTSIEPFEPDYNLSGHRFKAAQFHLKQPYLYSFTNDADEVAPFEIQMWTQFPLCLDTTNDLSTDLTDAVLKGLERRGYDVKIMYRYLRDDTISVYKVFVFGERQPMAHGALDALRNELIQSWMSKGFPLIERAQWNVSHPMPVSILPNYMDFVRLDWPIKDSVEQQVATSRP